MTSLRLKGVMAHINELVDFTVGAFIVFDNKVLLVDHIKLKRWLPVGGHIDLGEDPDQALFREIEEESGLSEDDIEVLSDKVTDLYQQGTKFLYRPEFVDIHNISEVHKHVGLMYVVRSKTDKIVLAEKEHNGIRWFTKEELDDAKYNVSNAVRFYATKALEKVK